MNQAVKRKVYQQGTQKQVNFIKAVSGMSEEQGRVFQMWHDGWADIDIAAELGMDAKAFAVAEEEVSKKTHYAILRVIDFAADNNMI